MNFVKDVIEWYDGVGRHIPDLDAGASVVRRLVLNSSDPNRVRKPKYLNLNFNYTRVLEICITLEIAYYMFF